MLKYCEECHDMVEYSVNEKEMTKNIKGKKIDYTGKVAICNICESEIFVAEIRDYNLMMLDNAYRESQGIISISEMEEILEKYNIGKRPLSQLLGWGEGTLSRYLEGHIPTKQYSDTLKLILNNSDYMKKMLEENRDKITDVAYRGCNKALLEIEEVNTIGISSNEKIDQVVKYLLVGCSDITPLALQKLLYYVQGFFRAFTGDFIFEDNCEAWMHGPVYRSVYNKYKNYGYNPIEEGKYSYSDTELTEIEKEIVDSVIGNFGCYSGKILERMTHAEVPWSHTRIGLRDDESSNRIIEKELIAKYFEDVKLKHNMLNISDVRDYSRDLFSKICI